MASIHPYGEYRRPCNINCRYVRWFNNLDEGPYWEFLRYLVRHYLDARRTLIAARKGWARGCGTLVGVASFVYVRARRQRVSVAAGCYRCMHAFSVSHMSGWTAVPLLSAAYLEKARQYVVALPSRY